MSMDTNVGTLHLVGIEELKRRWGWFLALGVLLVILGAVAIGHSIRATLLTVEFIGWLMIAAGALEALHAFSVKAWSGFFIDLLAGVLYIVVGIMFVTNPVETGIALTMLMSVFLIFGGIFRIALALLSRFQHWPWLLAHGTVNLLLGVMIWKTWPVSALSLIGLFVGIDLIFNGWTLIMLSVAAKNITAERRPA